METTTLTAANAVADRIRNSTITNPEIDALGSEDGLILDGVAVWFEAGTDRARLYAACVDVDTGEEFESSVTI